jgi:hypothetical protein
MAKKGKKIWKNFINIAKIIWKGFVQIATVAAGAAAVVAIVIALKAWRSSVEGSRELVERLDTISLRMTKTVEGLTALNQAQDTLANITNQTAYALNEQVEA